ncbi:hypothetical protein BC834DRAFT_884755, partial [Gloeopeniophorella convolvens]
MVNKRSTVGPKLLPSDPINHHVPDFRKPFSATLGLPIAPLNTAYYEGTGALYFRLSNDSNDKRIALLTCAHVVRPPPAFTDNTGMTRTNASQPKEHMVALGFGGYDRAITGMMAEAASLIRNIEVWNRQLARLSGNPERHHEVTAEVDKATRTINRLDALHRDVTKSRSIPELRTVGWALHSSPIQVSAAPLGYTEDWGLVELDPKQIDMSTFPGNKIFVGGKYSAGGFAKAMYPHHEDQGSYWLPEDSLVQASGVVSAATISNPQHLDVNGQKCLFVLKNGGTTGTTFGRANGLESVKRSYPEYVIRQADSLELAFSDAGDSGSIVVTREGKILGMVTGRAGPTDDTDVTWLTPYWWLQDQIKKHTLTPTSTR